MFVAVYCWRVHPGKEEQFREGWRRGTLRITEIYGSFGSRLHRNADGRFVGYAEWPDEATWRAGFNLGLAHDDLEARSMLRESIADGGEPVFTMTVVDDLLVHRSP